MRAVAARAGVSPASAYKYFPSKDALVATIYLNLLRDAPMHVDVNDTTESRVKATMWDMALVGADRPELSAAVAEALVADDPSVAPIRMEIASEISTRIRASLGPGWSDAVRSTLEMTFAGALLSSRFLPIERIKLRLEDAVNVILEASDG